MEDNKPRIFAPCSKKQQMVMQDETTDILLVGGGAGGGKSMICLMKYLSHLQDKDARILVARQTQPQCKVSGGLVDTSQDIYPHFGGEYRAQAMKWMFKSGATLQFAGIPDQKALAGWQGSQLTHVLIDEAAEHSEETVIFLLSRMRSAKFKGKMQMVLTCNPSNDSFLYKWVEPLLDPETGVPKEGTENVVRWFVNLNGKMYWGNSPEELYAEHGYGKKLWEDFRPTSFRFIPMTIKDNPVLMKNNPSYYSNLLAQNRVNQLRYLHGSWTARNQSSGYFLRDWCEVVDRPPPDSEIVARVRGYDLAATPEPDANSVNRSPDYTSGTLISRDKFGIYYIEHNVRYRKRAGDVMQSIINQAYSDGLNVPVVIPRDSGAGAVAYHQHMVRTLTENGLLVKTAKVSGHVGKTQRFLPLAGMCQAGNVKIVRGEWNDYFLEELENFDGGKQKGFDDCVDSAADAFNTIAKQMCMPTFTLPDLSRPSGLPF